MLIKSHIMRGLDLPSRGFKIARRRPPPEETGEIPPAEEDLTNPDPCHPMDHYGLSWIAEENRTTIREINAASHDPESIAIYHFQSQTPPMVPRKRQKPFKKAENQISFLGFRFPCKDPALFRRHLLFLAGISIFMKFFVVFITTDILSNFIDLFDIGFYFQYAVKIWAGQIPYVNFDYYYPPLSLISVVLPFFFAFIFKNTAVYVLAHQILMCAFDLGTTLLVYLVAIKFYDQKGAFLSGILSATAISTAYFVLTKFDAFPTFVLFLSLALFLYGRESAGYAATAAGFLVKWFPIVAYPYYLIHEHLQGKENRLLFRRVLIGALTVLVFTLPFIILSWQGLLFSYTYNIAPINQSQFLTQSQSLAYYLDYIVSSAGGSPFFGRIISPMMVLIQLALLAIYWRIGSRDLRVLCSFLFLAVLAFMLFIPYASPQYIIWVTPFLAILLARSFKEQLLFYAYQVWVYLEFPLLFQNLYSNLAYFPAPALMGIPAAFFFFTLKFALLVAILLVVGLQIRSFLAKPKGG
jgi:hypothetical protein